MISVDFVFRNNDGKLKQFTNDNSRQTSNNENNLKIASIARVMFDDLIAIFR